MNNIALPTHASIQESGLDKQTVFTRKCFEVQTFCVASAQQGSLQNVLNWKAESFCIIVVS